MKYLPIYLTADSKMTAKPYSRTFKNLKLGKRIGKWISTKVHNSRSQNPIKHPYILHSQVPQEVDHGRYLRLEINHDLSWSTHIENVTIKANRTLGFIRRNICTKHKGIRETAYNTLVRPQVKYASPVWSLYTQANINKVEKYKEEQQDGSLMTTPHIVV